VRSAPRARRSRKCGGGWWPSPPHLSPRRREQGTLPWGRDDGTFQPEKCGHTYLGAAERPWPPTHLERAAPLPETGPSGDVLARSHSGCKVASAPAASDLFAVQPSPVSRILVLDAPRLLARQAAAAAFAAVAAAAAADGAAPASSAEAAAANLAVGSKPLAGAGDAASAASPAVSYKFCINKLAM
jgi:hypothetical protein